jgi:F-type H+-transporting ATPase subunit b
MQIDWWTLALQTINVLVLVWILGRFFFQPVSAMIAARQKATAAALEQARATRAAAETDRQKARDEAARLAADRATALQEAAAEAAREKAALTAAARTEADQMRAAVAADIARQRQEEAVAEAARESRLAVDIAAKVLARLPPEARVGGFIAGLANAVAGLSESARAAISADGAPIRLRAAAPLSASEAAACREALVKVIGHPVEIAVEVDPNLLAGLELEAPHAVVRNSFRADLERIAAGLTTYAGE